MGFKLNFNPKRGFGICSDCKNFVLRIGESGKEYPRCTAGRNIFGEGKMSLPEPMSWCEYRRTEDVEPPQFMQDEAMIMQKSWDYKKQVVKVIFGRMVMGIFGPTFKQEWPPLKKKREAKKKTAGFIADVKKGKVAEKKLKEAVATEEVATIKKETK